MNRSTAISLLLLVLGGGFLTFQAAYRGVGRVYVQEVEVPGEAPQVVGVDPRLRNEPGVELSLPRTIGLWLAALLTLCIFSFLYADNPFYKFAEALFVGVSSLAAGHKTLVPQLIAALRAQGAGDVIVVCGGVIPPKDHAALKAAGVVAIYGPGTKIPESAAEVLKLIRRRRKAA